MEDQSSIVSVSFKLAVLGKELDDIKKRLDMYVPLRENDLQLKMIHDTVGRTEMQLASLSDKIIAQELEMQTRETTAQQNQARLQIKILWGTVSTIVGLLMSVLVGYVTHLFH